MPEPMPITLAQAALQSWHVVVQCDACRVGRLLPLGDYLLSPFYHTPLAKVAERRLFRCQQCGERASMIRVDRARVGVMERVAEYPVPKEKGPRVAPGASAR